MNHYERKYSYENDPSYREAQEKHRKGSIALMQAERELATITEPLHEALKKKQRCETLCFMGDATQADAEAHAAAVDEIQAAIEAKEQEIKNRRDAQTILEDRTRQSRAAATQAVRSELERDHRLALQKVVNALGEAREVMEVAAALEARYEPNKLSRPPSPSLRHSSELQLRIDRFLQDAKENGGIRPPALVAEA